MHVKIWGGYDKTQAKIGLLQPEPFIIQPKPISNKNEEKTKEENCSEND